MIAGLIRRMIPAADSAPMPVPVSTTDGAALEALARQASELGRDAAQLHGVIDDLAAASLLQLLGPVQMFAMLPEVVAALSWSAEAPWLRRPALHV